MVGTMTCPNCGMKMQMPSGGGPGGVPSADMKMGGKVGKSNIKAIIAAPAIAVRVKRGKFK